MGAIKYYLYADVFCVSGCLFCVQVFVLQTVFGGQVFVLCTDAWFVCRCLFCI